MNMDHEIFDEFYKQIGGAKGIAEHIRTLLFSFKLSDDAKANLLMKVINCTKPKAEPECRSIIDDAELGMDILQAYRIARKEGKLLRSRQCKEIAFIDDLGELRWRGNRTLVPIHSLVVDSEWEVIDHVMVTVGVSKNG